MHTAAVTARAALLRVARVARAAGVVTALAVGSIALSASTARAQVGTGGDPRIAARTLGYAGIEAYQAGDYPSAEQKLNRAFMLLPVPSLGLWSARALVKLGRLVEASQRYAAAARLPLGAGDPGVQRAAQADAAREYAELLPRIPSVTLELSGVASADVSVSIDGVLVSRAALGGAIPVNPGDRWVEALHGSAAAPGNEQRVLVHVAEGERKRVPLVFGAAPAGVEPAMTHRAASVPASDKSGLVGTAGNDGDRWPTVGWVSAGVGGGVLLASGITGLLAWAKLDDFDCTGDPCVSTDPGAIDDYESLRTASTVGYIAGGVLLAAGVVVLMQSETPEPQLSFGLGPGSAQLRGSF